MHIKVENMLVAKMITGCCWWVFISLSKTVHLLLTKIWHSALYFGRLNCVLWVVLLIGRMWRVWMSVGGCVEMWWMNGPWIRLLQCGLCDTCGSAFSGCDPALVAFYSVLWILTKILCNVLLGTSSMVKLLWELRIFLDIYMYDCQ